MSYQVHNFQPGDVLLASQLNEMDNQIALNESSSALESSIANEFSTSSTYAVGDYVIYEGQLYQCTTAVTTAGSWNSSNWTQAVLGNDVSDLKSAIDNIGGSLSDRAIQLLDTILSAAVYTSDQSANIEALIEELSGSGNVDNITVADGVMTILGLANTPTASGGILTIT